MVELTLMEQAMSITVSSNIVIGLPIASVVKEQILKQNIKKYNEDTGEPYMIEESKKILLVFDKQVESLKCIEEYGTNTINTFDDGTGDHDEHRIVGVSVAKIQCWGRKKPNPNLSITELLQATKQIEEKFKAIGWDKELHGELRIYLVGYMG